MSIVNTFPFFEADQVLTNNHLNSLFNYLDQQERLSRCKLIGSGIVCGLDISHTTDTINITKGCGLTSQGYIILLCDHTGANGYKYYMPFTKPAFPADLEIISQCGDPDLSNVPFYASPNTGASTAADDIQLLLTQDDFNTLSDNSKAVILSQGDLSKYAVVLFLDVTELKLKNCDTNDCNDKGSQMDFEVKVLLVNKKLLPSGNNNGNGKLTFSPLELKRYNVPVNNLNSSDDVLNGFVSLLTSDSILDTLANDLKYCFSTYNPLLNGITNYSFGSGADFKKILDFIRVSFPIYLQYVYDFIYDLIKAVDEFKYKAHSIISECCGDEMEFPFHLTLGEATTSTGAATSAYRQYFIYSPLFDSQSGGASELRSLLMRMILMHQGYLLMEKSIHKGLPQDIRITPSAYGRNFISDRCIPYYYKTVHDNTDVIAEDLYYYWSYEKTERGNAQRNLSYDPTTYTNANAIINPLNYDIEWYNFFRIEGHIGQPVTRALSNLISQKQRLNLPFDVVALSADYIGALLRGEDPKCIIQDLESDYRVLIAELVCKLHNGFCTAAKQKFTPPVQIFTPGIFNPTVAKAAQKKTAASKKASAKVSAATADVMSAILKPVNIAIDHPFISGLVNEFQATASYTKGDTLSRLCAPADGTVGSYYISSIKANQGKFVNPDPNNPLNSALFQFVDSVESMLQVLMIQDLSGIDPIAFKALYGIFEKATNALKVLLLGLINDLQNKETQDSEIDYLTDLLLNNAQVILQTCIAEKLEALKNEYLRRVAQYRLVKNFNYYFKKHGGIEHKAGVPRAGTFILVYHEERRNRFVDINSLFINKELSDVLLTNFRELLQPDVDLDTQEAKTKLLAVTTLYKDPSLYLRFKNVMQEYLDNCNDLPPDKKNNLTTIINQPPGNPTYQLTDGMIIADFYVPYMCCSDCLPIAYILPEAPAASPLQVSQSDPVCDQEGKNFTVTLTVTGGAPPYSYAVNNATVSNNEISLASGSPDTDVIIKDNSNQSITTTIKSHQCVQPCNLPCKGLSENCKYILWLPKPKDVLKDAIKHTTQKALLTLTDENGTNISIELTKIFQGIIDKTKLTEKTFDGALTKLVDAINVEVKAKAPNFLGNDKPMFTYDADTPGKFQNLTLDIERFTCHNIKLEIAATLAFTTQNQLSFTVLATYDNNAVSVQLKSEQQNFEFKVPKFDCTSIDKCAGTNDKLCKDKLQIKEINFGKDAAGNLNFTFNTAPAAPSFDTYFWYFHFGNPVFSTNAKPVISVQTLNPFFVRVIGINSKSGCYAILEQTLNLG